MVQTDHSGLHSMLICGAVRESIRNRNEGGVPRWRLAHATKLRSSRNHVSRRDKRVMCASDFALRLPFPRRSMLSVKTIGFRGKKRAQK